MQIVLSSNNHDKLNEIRSYLKDWEILAFNEVCEPFEIQENGDTFKQNALIKSKTLFKYLKNDKIIVIADDSGLCVPILGGEPGIYSARYAGENATYQQNTAKLIDKLKAKNLKTTKAYFTTAMAITSKWGSSCVEGFLHGDIIDETRGDRGFGYDPIFIPCGENRTLGQMTYEEKLCISHRSKALDLAKKILISLPKE